MYLGGRKRLAKSLRLEHGGSDRNNGKISESVRCAGLDLVREIGSHNTCGHVLHREGLALSHMESIVEQDSDNVICSRF